MKQPDHIIEIQPIRVEWRVMVGGELHTESRTDLIALTVRGEVWRFWSNKQKWSKFPGLPETAQ